MKRGLSVLVEALNCRAAGRHPRGIVEEVVPGLVLVALLDGGVAEDDPQHVHLGW